MKMRHLFILLTTLSLGACAIGKAPVYGYGQTGFGTVTIIESNPWGYVRTPICRTHGFPEAEGFYGCSEDKRQ